jgi:hypothetical protein
MNNAAYDISYLLELEAASPAMPEFRSARPAIVKPEASDVSVAQQRLAVELLQMEDQHEEMIRQYMSLTSESKLDAVW